ncbi:carboxylating nicotinate-nucleotide diphosphorylase [Nemorincola caseinilytica]|uniref:nicotinate-nucleotide diphosphorylase (carboxylating) n=1 Tax=Nemorincola caseinilytica TaxID=2054315 RepID=A0ABP8NE52_9BACT
MNSREFIEAALREDVGAGDLSTLACIAPAATGRAILKIKEDGLLAGVALAQEIFHYLEPQATFTLYKHDGDSVHAGETAFEVSASVHTILKAERLVLNCMQRMSGIATLTSLYVAAVKGHKARVLDTRKTTPLFRMCEKEAVRIGGGRNHRMGLYDMVMLKDNHIDFCGGIEQAIERTNTYLRTTGQNVKIEIETRSIDDVRRVLAVGQVHRIMLDNYTPTQLAEAVTLINGKYETEASGGITLENIAEYAATGVDLISVGAITHHAVSLDLSLKAQLT